MRGLESKFVSHATGAAAVASANVHSLIVYDRDSTAVAAIEAFLGNAKQVGARSAVIREHPASDPTLSLAPEAMQLTKAETFLRTGAFDPEESAYFVAGLAKQQGGAGLWLAADLSWASESGFNAARLLAYERRLQDTITRLPIASLCLYDRRRGSTRVITDVLRIHPSLFTPQGVIENPAYVEPSRPQAPDGADTAMAAPPRPLRIGDLRGLSDSRS